MRRIKCMLWGSGWMVAVMTFCNLYLMICKAKFRKKNNSSPRFPHCNHMASSINISAPSLFPNFMREQVAGSSITKISTTATTRIANNFNCYFSRL